MSDIELIPSLEKLKRPLSFRELQLQLMPLSGVTEREGLTGLIERYSADIRDLDEQTQERLNQCLAISLEAHKNDTYGNLPYASHLVRVMLRLKRDYEVTDGDILCAALLHDLVEDHPEDVLQLYESIAGEPSNDPITALGELIGAEVATLVGSVTNPERPSGLTNEQRLQYYADNVAYKISLSYKTFLIKLSDFTDNGVGLHWGEDEVKTARIAKKYMPVFDIFLDQIDRYVDSGDMQNNLANIARKQMQKGKISCQQILDAAKNK